MLCGFYESNITPRLKENMPGYFVFREASYVRDELYSHAAAFSNDNGDSFIIISSDCLTTPPSVAQAVRQRITELCGVPGENVMVAATHTHTGGSIPDLPGSEDPMYTRFLIDRIADTAVMAWNKRKPVRIGYGKAHEDSIAFNRRYEMADGSFKTNPGFANKAKNDLSRPDKIIVRPASVIDPEVVVVKIEDLSGKLMGVITNYACHLDTVGGFGYSADYPGELSRVLKSVYGQDVVSLFLTGACGNINHYDFIGRTQEYYNDANPPHYVRMGRILAGTVIRCLSDVETEEGEQAIGVAHRSIIGKVRTPSEEDIADAKALLEKDPFRLVHINENSAPGADKGSFSRHFAYSLLEVHEKYKENKEETIPVQVARVGKAAFAGMPCELFVEFGLDIKMRSGFDYTCISTLTNSHFGYIATRESFRQGGYETTISGETKMAPDTGYDLADTAVELMKKIR